MDADGNIVADSNGGSDQKVDTADNQNDKKSDASDLSKLDKPGWDPNFTGSIGGGNISGYKDK
jgi:hypothetical protein